jgi:hypothetical protein
MRKPGCLLPLVRRVGEQLRTDGSHRIDLTFINPYEGQRVVVACTEKRAGELDLAAGCPTLRHLSVSLPSRAGENGHSS